MKRFKMVALLRDTGTDQGRESTGSEQPMRINVTAATEEEARRAAVAQAMAVGCCITRFLVIKEKQLDT